MNLADRFDDLALWIAFHLPRRLVYWCAVRVIGHASYIHRQQEMDTLTPAQCLKAWREKA